MNMLPKLVLLFCLIAASAHAITMKEAPKGMYIFSSGFLSATNQAVTSAGTAISNANCDGVRWKLRWSDVEATPDTYTWQYLDNAVALAAANSKKCGISINAGKDCPAWLYAARVTDARSAASRCGSSTGPLWNAAAGRLSRRGHPANST